MAGRLADDEDPIAELRAKFLAAFGRTEPDPTVPETRLGYLMHLYLTGRMAGDDYPEPLSDADKVRLGRHVLP